MSDCATGILIDIDTSEEETQVNKNWFIVDKEYIEDEINQLSKLPFQARTKKETDVIDNRNIIPELLKLSLQPKIQNGSNILSSNKNKTKGEDQWNNITNCDGELLIENEVFDFSFSLSPDDSSKITDDNVFHSQDESSKEEKIVQNSSEKQNDFVKLSEDQIDEIKKEALSVAKNVSLSSSSKSRRSNKRYQIEETASPSIIKTKRKLQTNSCDLTQDVSISVNEEKENFIHNTSAKILNDQVNNGKAVQKSNKTTVQEGNSLIRQNTFTLSPDDKSLKTARRKSYSDVKVRRSTTSEIVQKIKPPKSSRATSTDSSKTTLGTIPPKRIEKERTSRKLSYRVTRPTSMKRSLHDSEISCEGSITSPLKRSNLLSLSRSNTFLKSSDSRRSSNSQSFSMNNNIQSKSSIRKLQPIKAVEPLTKMTRSTKLEQTKKQIEKLERKTTGIYTTSSLSSHPRHISSSSSFVPKQLSLNPVKTSTPNRQRVISNSGITETPTSVRRSLRNSGLPTPIRSFSTSETKFK